MQTYVMDKFNDYSLEAVKTAVFPRVTPLDANPYAPMSLAAESGELCGKIAKLYRGDKKASADMAQALIDEAGDVLWQLNATVDYINQICGTNYSLQDVAALNLAKLKDRMERNVIKGDGDQR